MEIADELLLYPYEGKRRITNIGFEKRIIERMIEYLNFFKKLEIEPPIFLMISLLNVRDYEIDFGNLYIVALELRNHRILEKNLILPERVIESLEEDVTKVLKPCFDMIWNACNFDKGSPNYNSEGKWIFLGLTVFGVVLWYLVIQLKVCTDCINFSCVLNRVPKEIRDEFLKKNPEMYKAWKKSGYKFDE